MSKEPQTAEEAKLALRTFNAKFEQVKEYSFFQHVKLSSKTHYDFETGEATHETDLPTDEQIDAALLNLRFFFVTNECSTIENLPKIYAMIGANQDQLDAINHITNRWHTWKSKASVIGGYSNYSLFEMMIYGNRLHRNQQNRCDIYDGWMKLSEMGNVALVDLCNAMHTIMGFANDAYQVNKYLLK